MTDEKLIKEIKYLQEKVMSLMVANKACIMRIEYHEEHTKELEEENKKLKEKLEIAKNAIFELSNPDNKNQCLLYLDQLNN